MQIGQGVFKQWQKRSQECLKVRIERGATWVEVIDIGRE
jgi:hypothetical protein